MRASRLRPLTAILLAILLNFALASGGYAISLPAGQVQQLTLALPENIYNEVGDAGNHLNPQSITGTNITQITGDIGSENDPTDAFKFFFAGGNIQFIGAVFHPTFGTIPLFLDLFAGALPTDPMTPNINAPGAITFLGLGPGNYIIEGNFLLDPPFTIGMLNPAGGPQVVSAPVPEPLSLTLLAAGLTGLGLLRRRLEIS